MKNRKRRLGRVVKKSSLHFIGYYKDWSIEIQREPDGQFYIMVTHPSHGIGYDGWWGSELNGMDEAIQEAFRGAML